MPLVREGHKGKIHGVEHQLDRHEDRDEVALDQKADDAEAEQDGAQKQIPGERDFLLTVMRSLGVHLFSIAVPRQRDGAEDGDRISTDVTSNGSSSFVKRTPLLEVVSVAGDADLSSVAVADSPGRCRITVAITARIATTAGTRRCVAARLPSVRSSRPAFSSMTTKVKSTMMAPA